MAPSSGGAKALAVGGAVSVQAVFATYQLLGAAVLHGGLDPIAFALLREAVSGVMLLLLRKVALSCVLRAWRNGRGDERCTLRATEFRMCA